MSYLVSWEEQEGGLNIVVEWLGIFPTYGFEIDQCHFIDHILFLRAKTLDDHTRIKDTCFIKGATLTSLKGVTVI